jgi:hypothetical protein
MTVPRLVLVVVLELPEQSLEGVDMGGRFEVRPGTPRVQPGAIEEWVLVSK